jgi:dienelactone hydrolase
MKSLSFVVLFMASSLFSVAQYSIGHTTFTFNDPNRSGGFGSGGGPGRQIQTELYYPANSAGVNAQAADGQFPVFVVGHGFVMTWDVYANIWQYLVPKGYIVALPRTEGGLSPSHSDFGLDIALVANKMQELGTNVSSPLFGHVASPTAVGGHSMGGGASVLAAAGGSGISAYVGFASAETTPSAIGAAADLTVPFLIFSGSADGVTPPAEHQIPIYNAASSDCKYHISITGGGHCYFANSSGTCDFGELFTAGNITITRAQQQQTVNDYMLPWLEFWLKGQTSGIQDMGVQLATDNRVTHTKSCSNPVGVSESLKPARPVIYPNPASDFVRVLLENVSPIGYALYDSMGRTVLRGMAPAGDFVLDIRGITPGVYLLKTESGAAVSLVISR